MGQCVDFSSSDYFSRFGLFNEKNSMESNIRFPLASLYAFSSCGAVTIASELSKQFRQLRHAGEQLGRHYWCSCVNVFGLASTSGHCCSHASLLPAVVSLFFFVLLVFLESWLFVRGDTLSLVVVDVGNFLLDRWLSLCCGCARWFLLWLCTSSRFARCSPCFRLRLFLIPIRSPPWDCVAAFLLPTVFTVNLILRLRQCFILLYPDIISCARHQLNFLFVHPVVIYWALCSRCP